MKKNGLVIIIVISLLLVTGCSEKTLICNSTGSDVGRKAETHVEVHFKGKKASKVKENIDMKFEDQYKKTIPTIYKTLISQYKNYKKEDGIIVKVDKTEDTIKVKINIDVKIQENKENAENVIDVTGSRDQIKKSLENSGYTCKK